LVGADVVRLEEMLAFDPPSDGVSILSIGGANIFDMVYMTGIVAVIVALIVFRARKKQEMYGIAAVATEQRREAERLPYAKDMKPSPTLYPTDKLGRYERRRD
jgi:hypothetical protein